MHFRGIEVTVTDELTVAQEHWNLMAEPRSRRRIAIDVDDLNGNAGDTGQREQGRHHLVAQSALRAGIQNEFQCWVRSPARKERTECAMNSTVCAGTSPTAVT